MISRNSCFTESISQDKVTLATVCPSCNKPQKIVLEGARAAEYKKGKVAYEAGYRIQDAFPSFTPSEREFILTGICDKCWESM